MKKKYILVCLLIMICITKIASAQTTFQKLYGGITYNYGYDVNLTSDGGFIITGVSSSFGAGNDDVYLIKTNANGDTLWSRTFGGANSDDGHAVQQTSDGGFIIAGNTSSFGSSAYVIRTDANGNKLWTKTFGGSVFDYFVSVQQTSDNGFIFCGYTLSFGAGSFDIYLVKTGADGSISWTKTYGGLNNDYGSAVRQTSEGGYIITGYSNSFGGTNEKVCLIKTDANGNPSWSKTYGGANQERGYDVKQTSDGGYIVTGYSSSFGAGGNDVYLLKTDASGAVEWSETFGGGGNDFGYSVEQTSDKGYIVGGNTTGVGLAFPDVLLIKTDSDGVMTMAKTYGGGADDEAFSVKQTSDDGYIVSGFSNSYTTSYFAYFIKTDAHLSSGCHESNFLPTRSSATTQVSTVTFQVSSGGTANTPATIQRGGVEEMTLCVTVGIDEIKKGTSVSAYPNPFKNEIFIKGTSVVGTVTLFDITGKVIGGQKTAGTETRLSTDNLLPGIYFVRYTDGNYTSTIKVTKF